MCTLHDLGLAVHVFRFPFLPSWKDLSLTPLHEFFPIVPPFSGILHRGEDRCSWFFFFVQSSSFFFASPITTGEPGVMDAPCRLPFGKPSLFCPPQKKLGPDLAASPSHGISPFTVSVYSFFFLRGKKMPLTPFLLFISIFSLFVVSL